MKNLIDSIFLDTYNMSISYACGMQDVICALSPVASYWISENTLTTESKLFGLEDTFRIVFSFGVNSIDCISASPFQVDGDSKELFRRVQKKLVCILGFPTNIAGFLLNLLNDDKKHVWAFSIVKITHSFWEHFGFREEIVIQPIDVT